MMKAIEIISHLYERFQLQPDFGAELWDHLCNGVVISRPHAFVMAKAVALEDGRAAWMIAAAAGELRELITFFPFTLPYIAFRRRGETRVRVYPLARFLRRASRRKTTADYADLTDGSLAASGKSLRSSPIREIREIRGSNSPKPL